MAFRFFIKEVYLDMYTDNATVHASGKSKVSLSLNYKPVQMILKTGACKTISLFSFVKLLS